jgi:hypothetical protein
VGRLVLVILAFAILLWPAQAYAATVVIVRPANSTPALAETVVRIHGELISAGFGVAIVDGSTSDGRTGRDSRDALERLAEQQGADAVVAIVGDIAPDSVEVWVVDKLTKKSVIRRLPFEPQSERAPQTLAIRAIELLRSSFLEIHWAPKEPSEPPATAPPAVVRFVGMEPPPARTERVGVEVGAAGALGFGGVGLAVLPIVRFDWVLYPWLVAQASLAGLGTRPKVETRLGSAEVAQAYGAVGACYRLRAGRRLQPFLSLSAGALHTSVEGRANSPNQGQAAQQWSFLLDGGLGSWLKLRDRFYLALAAHVQMAEPYLGVRFIDTVVATSGRPNVLLTLTVGAWL